MQDFYYIELFDLYKGLLTETQRQTFFSHYCLDLSLAEIGEEFGMTRQSVYDAIKTVKDKLTEYERILGLRRKNQAILAAAQSAGEKTYREIKDIIED